LINCLNILGSSSITDRSKQTLFYQYVIYLSAVDSRGPGSAGQGASSILGLEVL